MWPVSVVADCGHAPFVFAVFKTFKPPRVGSYTSGGVFVALRGQ